MEERKYYSYRTGIRNDIDFETLKDVIRIIFLDYKGRQYFTKYIYENLSHTRGIESHLIIKLRKFSIWPIESCINSYTEEDLFDIVELLYDLISKPMEYGLGFDTPDLHVPPPIVEYSDENGKREFQKDINDILSDYQDGYELSNDGEILSIGDLGFDDLLNKELPAHDPENIDDKIKIAVSKFRRHYSSIDDKKDALRDLAAVLEFLKPKIKDLKISKDTDALFNIANNFAIRHHNQVQQKDYDKPIWFTWTFYTHLATIHAIIKLLKKYNVDVANLSISNQDR